MAYVHYLVIELKLLKQLNLNLLNPNIQKVIQLKLLSIRIKKILKFLLNKFIIQNMLFYKDKTNGHKGIMHMYLKYIIISLCLFKINGNKLLILKE